MMKVIGFADDIQHPETRRCFEIYWMPKFALWCVSQGAIGQATDVDRASLMLAEVL
jgi:hypothetical protein